VLWTLLRRPNVVLGVACGARYKTRPGLSYHLSHSHNKPPPPEDELDPIIPSTAAAADGQRIFSVLHVLLCACSWFVIVVVIVNSFISLGVRCCRCCVPSVHRNARRCLALDRHFWRYSSVWNTLHCCIDLQPSANALQPWHFQWQPCRRLRPLRRSAPPSTATSASVTSWKTRRPANARRWCRVPIVADVVSIFQQVCCLVWIMHDFC